MKSPLEQRETRIRHLDRDCLDDIARTLFRFRTDPKFRGKSQRVPLRQFSTLCGVSRQTLYAVMRGDIAGLETATRDRILTAIDLVLNRGVRWKRTATKAVREVKVTRKQIVRTIVPAIITWTAVLPDGTPVTIPRGPMRGHKDDHPQL